MTYAMDDGRNNVSFGLDYLLGNYTVPVLQGYILNSHFP